MSALLNTVIPFALPKKPRVREKAAPPDQRQVCVMPFRAVSDKSLTDGGIRVLAAVCSYCNRAGITWVSQNKLAADLGCTRQSITNQIAQLRRLGYVEVVSKSWKGVKPNTIRVVFDPTIDTATAIANTSNKEDTRPPEMREQQEKQMEKEVVDVEGQRRIAQMLVKALKQPRTKEPVMPKPSESVTVRMMKEEIAKTQAKRSRTVSKSVDNSQSIGHPTVSNESALKVSNEGLHRQPIGHSTMSPNTGNTVSIRSLKEDLSKRFNTVLGNREVNELIEAGMTDQQVREAEADLLPLFTAEGITPTASAMSQAILQMHKDAA